MEHRRGRYYDFRTYLDVPSHLPLVGEFGSLVHGPEEVENENYGSCIY